jgi:hypothetical protein
MPEVALFTPVKRGAAPALRKYLRELPSGGGPVSPFARGPAGNAAALADDPEPGITHFARFVVIRLGGDDPRLLFTTRFDGDEHTYLAWLASLEAAQMIWAYCERPGQSDAETLRRYLSDPHSPDRLQAEYVVSLVADGVSVPAVNRALALREQLRAFAQKAQGMTALELAQAFRMLEAVGRVAEA